VAITAKSWPNVTTGVRIFEDPAIFECPALIIFLTLTWHTKLSKASKIHIFEGL
jgi:hypothetical protein